MVEEATADKPVVKQHVRPKVRSKAAAKTTARVRVAAVESFVVGVVDEQEDTAIEDVRSKMGQWMGLNDNDKSDPKVSASERMFPPQSPVAAAEAAAVGFDNMPIPVEQATTAVTNSSYAAPQQSHQESTEKPKGILKKPKYSGAAPAEPQSTPSPQILSTLENGEVLLPTDSCAATTTRKTSVFKQERIQERDPSQTNNIITTNNFQGAGGDFDNPNASIAVEGYAPLMDRNMQAARQKRQAKNAKEKAKKETEQKEPLVFNSLADMMQTAGNLPSQDLTDNPQVVEGELAFSCMSPGDYQEGLILQGMEQQQAQQTGKDANSGNTKETKEESSSDRKDVTFDQNIQEKEDDMSVTDGDDNYEYTSNPADEEEYDSGDEEGAREGKLGGFFDLVAGEESDEEVLQEPVPPPRAFRVLWECLSPLITRDSCLFLRRLEREADSNGTNYLVNTTPASDLEASRSTGFMAMLRMYMARSLKELGQSVELRRTVEQRLQGLVLTFSFSRPAAKLETKEWRALTCVLVEIVLFLAKTREADDNSGVTKRAIPQSAQVVGMKDEEYNYMVKSTIKTFDIPDPVI